MNQIKNELQQQVTLFNQRLAAFFGFLLLKLTHFKSLTLAEQLSFGAIGMGLVLVITSAILFLL